MRAVGERVGDGRVACRQLLGGVVCAQGLPAQEGQLADWHVEQAPMVWRSVAKTKGGVSDPQGAEIEAPAGQGENRDDAPRCGNEQVNRVEFLGALVLSAQAGNVSVGLRGGNRVIRRRGWHHQALHSTRHAKADKDDEAEGENLFLLKAPCWGIACNAGTAWQHHTAAG